MIDETRERTDETTTGEAAAQDAPNEKAMEDPFEQLRALSRGKLKLMRAFRAHGEDVTELSYDFCRLTSEEMMDALDSVPVNNMFAISNKQALALFAATCEKEAPMTDDGGRQTRLFDARDVKGRLSAADGVKAVQLAKLFYTASNRAGNGNISNG